jgi:hypothetical protein
MPELPPELLRTYSILAPSARDDNRVGGGIAVSENGMSRRYGGNILLATPNWMDQFSFARAIYLIDDLSFQRT